MFGRCYRKVLLLGVAALALVLSAPSGARTTGVAIYLTACDGSPAANTLALQQEINDAPDGATLVLPSGVCTLAKCTVANQSVACYGLNGAGRHFSAVDVGKKTNLTLAGAADGTSVLKLDPDPPRRSDGYHAYCGDTHVLSIRKSSNITLRDFTVDGSDGELPEDTTQCPSSSDTGGKIDEHMHDVQVANARDVTIDRMKLIRAHGDGLNLIADKTPSNTDIFFTERVSVTHTDFLDNDRSGITFQRNVGYVRFQGNYLRNSGQDQDLDMESTGGQDDLGPYEVDIDDNLFERVRPGLTVTLGGGHTQWSSGVRFTNNTIQGGCISVYKANGTVIAGNTIISAPRCSDKTTLSANRVTDLRVENNYIEGYVNKQDDQGKFAPRPVINVSADWNKQPSDCKPAPGSPCAWFIYYPVGVTIRGNTIIQHVQYSHAIKVSDVEGLILTDNTISHTHEVPPAGTYDPNSPNLRPRGLSISFEVPDLGPDGYYLNQKSWFKGWSITGNRLSKFADGIRIAADPGIVANSAVLSGNVFNTAQSSPRGIWLVGPPGAPQSGFINSLMVDGNLFGCGFPPTGFSGLPPNAFVRPSGQAYEGNVGFTVACTN